MGVPIANGVTPTRLGSLRRVRHAISALLSAVGDRTASPLALLRQSLTVAAPRVRDDGGLLIVDQDLGGDAAEPVRRRAAPR